MTKQTNFTVGKKEDISKLFVNETIPFSTLDIFEVFAEKHDIEILEKFEFNFADGEGDCEIHIINFENKIYIVWDGRILFPDDTCCQIKEYQDQYFTNEYQVWGNEKHLYIDGKDYLNFVTACVELNERFRKYLPQ